MTRGVALSATVLCFIAMGCGGNSGSQSSPPPNSPSPDFSIAVQPSTLSLTLGLSTQIQITESPANGFSAPVSVNVASLPAGVTVSPTLPQIVGSSGLTLSVTAAATAPAGSYTIEFSASGGNVHHSASLSLTLATPAAETIPGNRTNWVRLGSNPIAVYYDAPRNHVFASLPAVNRVDVIDPTTGNLLSSIPVSVANNEPNGVWLASSSNLSATLDGTLLLALGAGHIANIDLASEMVVAQQVVPRNVSGPTFLVAAAGGHIILGSWGGSFFYNWDGVSTLASQHSISDLYSFDRNFDGTTVLVASGDTSGVYELLDVASDSIVAQSSYSNATIMTVRGNPVRGEWAIANSAGIDFLDPNLNLVGHVAANLAGSSTYWGMTYSPDGKYLYFVYSPNGLPFLITVDATTHSIVSTAPATGTDLAYYRRVPPEWVVQPFAADGTGLVFGLGEKGVVIDDSTYTVDPAQATDADSAIIATPDNGPVTGSTTVQITTQVYNTLPDVWFGSQRAPAESLNSLGQVSAATPPTNMAGPVNIKLFPPDGYVHVMPQAFTYGTIITSLRNSVCASTGGCSVDIFGFGLFGSDTTQTKVTIGGNAAAVQSVHYFSTDQPYPYPLQYLSVLVPSGRAGRADVSVKTANGQATMAGAFLYSSSLQSYASAQPYNALLFDEKRQLLYASTDSQIARFSVASSTFLSPITPPSLSGQYQLEGMCLTPDGSKLIVANKLDSSVSVIDPDNPSNAVAIGMPTNLALYPGGPVFVAATSTGKVIISMTALEDTVWTGPLLQLDLTTSQVLPLPISALNLTDGLKLSATSDGSTVLIGARGLWTASTGQFSPVEDNLPGSGPAATAGDGNVFAIGDGFDLSDGTSYVRIGLPDELGVSTTFAPNDAALNDSGSLEFIPWQNTLYVVDTHHGDVVETVLLPNQVNYWTKTIALDTNAQHVFLTDSKGLTVLTLTAAPLAIGSVDPPIVSVSGGTTVTVRGSGFQQGTTVTIGGHAASSSFIDPNTLQVTVPSNATDAAQMVVRNPDGETYELDSAVVYQ